MKHAYIWEVERSAKPSPFLQGSQVLGTSDKVHLIDQFKGRLPALVNEEFLQKQRLDVTFRPGFLLDSNMVDDIDRRVRGGKGGDGLEAFLNFALSRQWDVNPLFYCLEHLSKSSPDQFRKNAVRRVASIIHVHVADVDRFLDDGTLEPNPDAMAATLDAASAQSIEALAEMRVDSIIKRYDAAMLRDMLAASQIILIKMVLIEKQELPKATLEDKLDALHGFVESALGVQMAREAHLAAHYFAGLAGSLLGIQSTTSADRALRIVRSTAWDLFLLRFPEMTFQADSLDVDLMYVATKEVQLYQLGRLFSLEAIIGGETGPIPVLSYDLWQIAEPARGRLAGLARRPQQPPTDRLPHGLPPYLLEAIQRQLVAFCAPEY